ncbi:hypothetical protein T484DRAFT_1757099 [Baffinella frigidus]|nr:hypothetical protein T484DRAFT_1757099 [Cryptophyta sp. CCMP2293]
MLLSEFMVSANLKDSKHITLLDKAPTADVAWNIDILLTGCVKNKAKVDDGKTETVPFIPPKYGGKVFNRNKYESMGCIPKATAMSPARHLDSVAGKDVDSTASAVKALLDRGASIYYYDNTDRDFNGWSA